MSTLAQQVALGASDTGSQLGTYGHPNTPTSIHKHPIHTVLIISGLYVVFGGVWGGSGANMCLMHIWYKRGVTHI